MISRKALEPQTEHLITLLERAITTVPDERLYDLSALLEQSTRTAQAILEPQEALADDLRSRYFPPRNSHPSAVDVELANQRWHEAAARGESFRTQARNLVGPLLTPAQARQRLGISAVTLNKWRRTQKVLGLHFDGHQNLYPAWQFAESPLQGEHGVLYGLDRVLQALGARTEWEKALFLLSTQPALHGKRPLDILALPGPSAQLERLLQIAPLAGEMGA